jgi:hypothetical protein
MAMTEEQLEAFGEQVTIITERLGEMANALDTIVASQSQIAKSAADAKAKTDGLAAAADKSGRALENKAKIEQEIAEEQRKRDAARESAQTAAVRSLASFGDALLSTEKGFSKFSGSLESAGDAAFDLGKSFGGLTGLLLGAAAKAVTLVAEKQLKQADDLLTASDAIKQTGAANVFTTEQVRKMGQGAGLTSETLDKLIKPMTSMGGALRVLGAGSSEAVENFAKMNSVTQKTREDFQRLGFDDEQRIKASADYLQLLQKTGGTLTAQQRTSEHLAKQTKAYTENLLVLAELSGTDVETEKKKLEVTSATIEVALTENKYRSDEIALRNQLNGASEEEKVQIEARIAQIEKEREGLTNLNLALTSMNLSPAEKAAFQLEYLTGAVTSTAGGLLTSGIDIANLNQQLKDGAITVGEFRDSVLQSKQQTLDRFGQEAIALGGRETQDFLGLTVESIAELNREMTEGFNATEVEAAARARIAANEAGEGPSATDPAEIARNFVTETARAAQLFADEMLAATNPLLKGLEGGAAASAALTTAVLAATAVLGIIAAKNTLSAVTDGGGRGRGRRTPGRFSMARGLTELSSSGDEIAKSGSSVARLAGAGVRRIPVAGAVISGGMAAYEGFQENQDINRQLEAGEITQVEATRAKTVNTSSTIGETAGGAGGAFAGAATGAAIGSVVPVVGTIIGGLIGAAVGGWLGSKGGEMIGESLGETINVTREAMNIDANITTPETAYQASQFVGPPVPPVPPSLATSTAPAVSGIRTPDQTVTSITPQAEASSREGFRTPPPPEAITVSVPQTDINDIMMMLSYKLDTMIALLDTGVGIQDRLLLESRS